MIIEKKKSSAPLVLSEDEVVKPVSEWKRNVVEEQIASHKLELLAAENEVKHLWKRGYELDELLNRTAPIMTSLSLDSLIHIFAIACEDVCWGAPVQFLIGGVCREWRRIAWSTPKLWREIFVRLSNDRLEAQETLLQEWIGRTAASPLHVHLSQSYGWEPPVAFFSQLLKTCHRWITFNYYQPSLNFQMALAQDAGYQFPMLKSLDVNGAAKAPEDLNQWELNFPPQLRSLNVSAQRKFYLGVNWGALDTVNAMLNLQGCINMLGLSCSPKTLSLTILLDNPRTALPPKVPYCLRDLTIFDLEGATASVASLLRFITIPAVKELSVEFEYDRSGYSWIEDFTELARRSTFQLTKLTLYQTTISEEAPIFDILRNMPSMEYFDLGCAEPFTLSDYSVGHLNPASKMQADDGQTCFLPNVTSFTYRGEISFTLDALLGMMINRFEHLQKRVDSKRATTPLKDDPSMVELGIHLAYPNDSWYRNHDPNALHNFYTEVASLRGVALTLEWIQ